MDTFKGEKTIKIFLKEYFANRDIHKCECLIFENIVCFGNYLNNVVKGKIAVINLLKDEISKNPYPIEYEIVSLEKANECFGVCSYIVDLSKNNRRNNIAINRLIFTLCKQGNDYLIMSLTTATVANNRDDVASPSLSIARQEEFMREEFLGEAIAGGLLGVYIDNDYDLYYINKAMLSLLGYDSMEEYISITRGILRNFIYHEDVNRIIAMSIQNTNDDSVFHATFRMRKKGDGIVYISSYGRKIIAEDGRPVWISVCFDVSNEKAIEYKLESTTAQLKVLMDNVPGGISVFEIGEDIKTLFVNDGFCRMIGSTEKEFYKFYGEKALNCVYDEDLELVKKELKEAIEENRQIVVTFRIKFLNNCYKWVKLSASCFETSRVKRIFYGIFTDLSKEVENEIALKEATQRLEGLITNVPGAILIFDVGECIRPVFISEGYSKMTGFTNKEAFTRFGSNALDSVHKDDAEEFRKKVKEALRTNGRFNHTYRIICKDNSFKWVSLTASIICSVTGEKNLYAVYTDINDIINTQRKVELSHQLFELALKESHIIHWEYNILNKECILPSTNSEGKRVVSDFPNTVIKNKLIHESCIGVYKQLHYDVERGSKTVDGTVQILDEQGIYKWYHITYTTVFDEEGNPVKAIGIANDVTLQVAMQKMYRKEIEYCSEMEDNIVTYFCFNITKDILEEYCAKDEDYICNYDIGIGSEQFLLHMREFVAADDDRIKFEATFSKENLLQSFFEGKSKLNLSYRIKNKADFIVWVSTYINLMRHPSTGDIVAFIYTKNINTQKIMQSVIENITLFDYDYIICLSLVNNNYVMYTRNELVQQLPPKTCKAYEETFKKYIYKYVADEDKERVLKEISLKNIKEVLNSKKDFITYYSILDPSDKIRKKKLQCVYKDKENNLVLLTRSDVSDVYFEEQRKNTLLKDALLAAEQANIAKTEFLSRMSHEIRTPMNAIIGLTAIASQEIEYTEKVANSLSKIGLSARFLLSLINDILDMSRIESGKLSLKEETIYFEDFINNINSLMSTQAEAKGVEYESIVKGFVESTYIGDSLRLQQVLINIISNAVKFTPAGGKVQFFIEQIKSNNNNATLSFTVTDTGVGISEEYMPKLFEPFSQEHDSTTSCYGGTGLGLSICKNIVNMFGGNISVKSTKEKGTEFIVNVKLKIPKQDSRKLGAISSQNLVEIHALIVDGDLVSCKHTQMILRGMGVKAEWVSCGQEAVDVVSRMYQNNHMYDFIIIDFKMPDMDGTQTTRLIRSIVDPNVTIVIMTAYDDWRLIENDARCAGANMFMPKPVFETSILEILEVVKGKKKRGDKKDKSVDYDFKGKKILLVEDHPLNIQVARQLLRKRGFEVYVAKNGLECIEMFTQVDEGYFDAILMDVRMPVMDGLTAARGIRELEKEGSNTIPIIAMTANAFEEDVEKSRASGMNAHLAKPIEPRKMFSTLYELIVSKNKI